MLRVVAPAALLAALGVALAGCGGDGGGAGQKADPKAAAKAKVDAARKIAEAVAKDPNGDEAFIALEEFRNTSMKPKDFPEESREILNIYKKQIEGKLKPGEISQQIRVEFVAFRGFFEKG